MDTNEYWLERGKTYISEERLQAQFYKDQEEIFLLAARMEDPVSVIDLGCGFGRITRVLASTLTKTTFVGLDLSPEQVNNARKHCRGLSNIGFRVQDICSDTHKIGAFDMAVCSEVLLHLPEDSALKLIKKVLSTVRVLVHEVDPAWVCEDEVSPHCFFHDYARIYGELNVKYWELSGKGHKLLVVKAT